MPAFGGTSDTSPGEPTLTVYGKIRKVNQANTAIFDMAMLKAMPQHDIRTTTPWYRQIRTFTGPLLRDVLAACGAQGESLRLLALNDFRSDMPITDPQRFDIIVAHLLDGKPMSVRDKGPLFVMYPFSSHAELRSVTYYTRAVWQLHSIEVL